MPQSETDMQTVLLTRGTFTLDTTGGTDDIAFTAKATFYNFSREHWYWLNLTTEFVQHQIYTSKRMTTCHYFSRK